MTRLDELLTMLTMAPETQIDSTITERIKPLVGQTEEEVKAEMKVILDDCVAYSLCSDFSVIVMDGILNGQY